MAQCAVAGKGCRSGLSLILLTVMLGGCAAQPDSPRGDSSANQHEAQQGIAGDWVSIRRGDTLGKIAQRAGVPLVRLQRFNPGVDPRGLAVGQRVLVPGQRERAPSGGPYRYQIRPGDTFSSVARRFGVNPQAVVAANPGVEATDLDVGRLIQLPIDGGQDSRTSQSRTSDPAPASPSRQTASDSSEASSESRSWPWPLEDYTIARHFGKDEHGTLQPMLLTTRADERARAVADGQVRFASEMRQLGKVVIVHHPDNLQSVYARCRRLLVDSGQDVSRGTPLCEPGKANSGGHELLFDMRHGGKPMDPARVLR
ncbi:M23 family metallopeptidase [Halomonas sabkhae]|uniref:murein hydrolase activator EnvC family protein n=1 Tax=Halomonas sabkhae TaxID=626223 RepID=UPI0025B5F830|nr:M23 family metallopeptidase [Halomonas sabkhae]MDN3526482.1 M23 family metallopeptidase [Halomonas sabkhae]